MKVLLLAPHPYYIDRGTPIDVDILVRALSAQGHEVDMVVYRDGEPRDYSGVTIHRAPTPRWLTGLGPGFSLRKVLADVQLFRVASKLARQHRYDVIHAGEEAVFMAVWLKRRRGLDYIYDMDSSIAQQLVEKKRWLRPMARFFNWCEGRAIRGAVAAAPVCNALADLARQRGARHIVTLHDISQLANPDRPATGMLRERLELDASDDTPMLLYAGNLEKYQGIDLLLEAFALNVQQGAAAHLVIAGGSDDDIAAYRAKADRLGLTGRVHFIGPWPADRLDALLAEADVLVAPRITGINTPMKVFPYLHSGKPVLVTDLPTHSQILTDEVAMLAPPEPAPFAAAIAQLICDRALRERLGAAGRRFVERDHVFSAHQRRVETLYAHVAERIAATRRSAPAVHASPAAQAGTGEQTVHHHLPQQREAVGHDHTGRATWSDRS